MNNSRRKKLSKYRDRVIDIIRSVSHSEREEEAGILIRVGHGETGEIQAVLDSVSASTVVLYYLFDGTDAIAEKLREVFYSDRILFSLLSEEDYYSEKAGILTALSLNRKIVFSIPSDIEECIGAEIHNIQEAVSEALYNAELSEKGRLIYLRNSVFNLKKIINSPDIELLKSKKNGAVICAAGPSLKTWIETLKKYQSRFYIFCVGRVAPLLIDSGIKPDAVFHSDLSVDIGWAERISKNTDTVLVSSTSVHPGIAWYFKKILWFYGDSPVVNSFLNRNGINLLKLEVSRTITVSAVDFALKAGCGSIALLGSDLCISDSGRHHADEDEKMTDDYIGTCEISGNRGRRVRTIPELLLLKKSIEKYLASRPLSEVIIRNCSSEGAEITGAPYMNLEEFCREYSNEKKVLFSEKRPFADSGEGIMTSLSDALGKYKVSLDDVIASAGRLSDELTKATPDFDKAGGIQAELLAARTRVAEIRAQSPADFILSAIERQMDEIIRMMPQEGDNNSASRQLSLLISSSSFIRDLCADIVNDLKHEPENPYSFRCFRAFENYAISFIKRDNPDFAGFLKANRNCDYSFALNLQYLPYSVIKPDGSPLFRKDQYSFTVNTQNHVRRFIEDNSFDTNSMAIVFPAPGNWAHVVEFSKALPRSEIIVLELWPEMFSGIIRSCMFMHCFPLKTLVLGVDSRLPSWRNLYISKVNSWRAEGRKILFYVTPETAFLDETRKLLEGLRQI